MNDRPTWPELRRALLEETEPGPGLEERVLAGALPPPAHRRPSWLLGAAAIALALLVMATLLLAGGALRRATLPAATPPPSPAAAGPPPSVSMRALNPVAIDADGSGWVVEHAQQPPLSGGMTVMHTSDGGAHWTRQLDLQGALAQLDAGPSGQALLYVVITSTGTGGAATQPRDVFYSTGDGGAHWQQFPAPPGLADPGSVQMKDGREVWLTLEVASTPGTAPDQWVVYHSSDGARTWQREATVDLAATFGASNMAFQRGSSGLYGLFIPQIGNARPTRLFTTSDGGAHWRGAPMPGVPGGTGSATYPPIALMPDGHLVAMGQGGFVVSADGGQHWSEGRRLPAAAAPSGIRGLDATHWWLFGGDGQVYASGDEGASWTRVGTLPRGMLPEDVRFTSATAGWATAGYLRLNGENVLLTTGDGGRTWRTMAPPHPFHPAVPCGGAGATVTAHAHLTVTRNGKAAPGAVPAGVGVTDGCRYRLSTADASGTVDIATTPVERGRTYTLGDLLDVWGLPDVAAATGSFGAGVRYTVRVDGRAYTGDPRRIPLRDGTRVVIAVTSPGPAG